jgi:copper chaperone CopZ
MDTIRELRFPVYGLGCGGAGATSVERALVATHGVLRAYVNPATDTAYIGFDPSETDAAELARVVEEAGYEAGRPAEV